MLKKSFEKGVVKYAKEIGLKDDARKKFVSTIMKQAESTGNQMKKAFQKSAAGVRATPSNLLGYGSEGEALRKTLGDSPSDDSTGIEVLLAGLEDPVIRALLGGGLGAGAGYGIAGLGQEDPGRLRRLAGLLGGTGVGVGAGLAPELRDLIV